MQEVVARKIKPKRKGFRGKEPFITTGGMIHWDSFNERNYIRLADFDLSVSAIFYQPICIRYTHIGKKYRYFPDFKVITFNGKTYIVEVKHSKYFDTPKNRIKYEVGRKFCEENGWIYIVVTEKQIDQGYLQYNLALLRAHGLEFYDQKYETEMLDKLQALKSCYIFELREYFEELSNEQFFSLLYHLIYLQDIRIDLIGSKITDESVIYSIIEEEVEVTCLQH
ncbi:hypothetical protein GC098_28680 [Paenibacillus sp. LMG 31458]|uniref:TnsA endonuclease N-terminal domain-containing protein n=1 Tax=Paenibacillus phytorum TaxID=2654977 RepID=A0ABX1Y3Y6_9BACL|nr:TnsA endonuclease N-terminal domain-containing protein [Paenibacillus phytorum]NOU75314.1 hypothetical protein [Paenibacillus phytorum]